MMRISETVKHLIIINVVMFIGTIGRRRRVFYFTIGSLCIFLKMRAFQPWQIITHMFMHGGVTCIFYLICLRFGCLEHQ